MSPARRSTQKLQRNNLRVFFGGLSSASEVLYMALRLTELHENNSQRFQIGNQSGFVFDGQLQSKLVTRNPGYRGRNIAPVPFCS
jgi:hypothetical protein